MSPPSLTRVIVDTDPGIDDAMALLFLNSAPNTGIAAITTVFGNANVSTTTRNAGYLAQRFGIDAPVIAGADQPLQADRLPLPVHVHGQNGLGDLRLDGQPVRAPATGLAHERIVELVRRYPHQISILALGPLTNLALALRVDPDIADLVPRVVVMGGAFGWGNRRGNVSPVAEANMRNDPHAADQVLAASWPVTMVGLDVTMRCVFTAADAQRLAREGGDVGRFLWELSRRYESLYIEHDGLEGCCLHDVAAAACLLEPALFSTVSGPIRVVTEGIAIGQTIQRPPGQQFPAGEWDATPPQQACNDVDARRLIELYSSTLMMRAHATASTAP